MFQSLCGQEVLGNIFLTTTQWSEVDLAEAEFRENRLRNQGLWRGLIRKGAALQRFHGTRESGLELIHKLMSNTRKPLRIQDQIVKQKMTLLETDAGKCLNQEFIAQEKRLKKELESLKNKLREATKAKDNEIMGIIAAEQAKSQKKLERAVADRRWLEGLHAAEIEKRKAKEKEGQGVVEGHDKDGAPGPSDPQRFHNIRGFGLGPIGGLASKTRGPLDI